MPIAWLRANAERAARVAPPAADPRASTLATAQGPLTIQLEGVWLEERFVRWTSGGLEVRPRGFVLEATIEPDAPASAVGFGDAGDPVWPLVLVAHGR